MGQIEKDDCTIIRSCTIEYLTKAVPMSKNDILMYIIVLCQLLNCIFYKESGRFLVTSANQIVGKSNDTVLGLIYSYRNAFCHCLGTKDYKRIFRKLCEALECDYCIDDKFIGAIVTVANSVIATYCTAENSFMSILSTMHD